MSANSSETSKKKSGTKGGRAPRTPRMPPAQSGLAASVGSLTGGTAEQTAPAESAPQQTPAPAASTTSSANTPSRTGTAKTSQVHEDPPTTRSWYLPKSKADQLAAEIKRLYLELDGEVPKYEILGALVTAAAEQHETVRTRLKQDHQQE